MCPKYCNVTLFITSGSLPILLKTSTFVTLSTRDMSRILQKHYISNIRILLFSVNFTTLFYIRPRMYTDSYHSMLYTSFFIIYSFVCIAQHWNTLSRYIVKGYWFIFWAPSLRLGQCRLHVCTRQREGPESSGIDLLKQEKNPGFDQFFSSEKSVNETSHT